MKRPHQLYTVYKDVVAPHYIKPPTNNSIAQVVHRTIPQLPIVRWESGKPCISINAWLHDKAIGSTGSSIVTYASRLSHIVRYCSQQDIDIEMLTDNTIHAFVAYLLAEPSHNNPNEKRRNNNQVREIVSLTLRFLAWYQQKYILPLEPKLIGLVEESPKITVKRKSNPHSKRMYLTHSAMPPIVSTSVKTPIPDHIIIDIENQIEQWADVEIIDEKAKRKYANRPGMLDASVEYIRARRVFTLWMMKRTGLRPEELHEIPLDKNNNVLKEKCIVIPTKKRKKQIAPLRSFRIEGVDARKFNRYLRARNQFIDFLENQNSGYRAPNQILLGREGEAVKKESIRKDFDRLVNGAGFSEVKTCLSMFRHRFITREIIVYFKEFMTNTNKTRAMITDADYRSILKRIATKTGHGSEESLWHYIDLAWDEMGVWGNAEKGVQQLHAVDRLREDLRELQRSLKQSPRCTVDQVIDYVTNGLEDVINDTRGYLEPEA